MTTDIEAFIGQEGRDKAIQEVRKQIDAAGVEYMYYQFVSVTGRIMGKGIPAAHWENIANKGFQLVYGATANLFVDALEKGDLGESAQATFNAAVNAQFDGTRDYIVAHYKTNTRTDTDYWRANAANTQLSDSLTRLLKTWLARRPIVGGIQQGAFGQGYPVMSWYSLLAGMGLFPDDGELRAPAPNAPPHSLAAIDNLIRRSALNFPDHREFLQAIAPRSREESLQVYFW